MTVVDPRTNPAIAAIDAGEKMEFVVAGDPGVIYAAGEAKRDLLKIDARTNEVVARWGAPDCESPHGLTFDLRGRRLFMGCVNSVMVVIDADTGRVVSKLPIGRGSDAVAYDPQRKRVFSSTGVDGTLTFYQQGGSDRYTALDAIPTAISGRTLTWTPLPVGCSSLPPKPIRARHRGDERVSGRELCECCSSIRSNRIEAYDFDREEPSYALLTPRFRIVATSANPQWPNRTSLSASAIVHQPRNGDLRVILSPLRMRANCVVSS